MLESSRGRTIFFVSNGSRAMVMLLEHDDCPDHDTVPMGEALRILAHLVAEGVPPGDTPWEVDR